MSKDRFLKATLEHSVVDKLRPADTFIHRDDVYLAVNKSIDGFMVRLVSSPVHITLGKNERIEIIKSLEIDDKNN